MGRNEYCISDFSEFTLSINLKNDGFLSLSKIAANLSNNNIKYIESDLLLPLVNFKIKRLFKSMDGNYTNILIRVDSNKEYIFEYSE